MAISDGSFRTRAASLLHPYVSTQNQAQVQQTNLERSPTVPLPQHAEFPSNEKGGGKEPTESGSLSATEKTFDPSHDDTVAQNKKAQRLVRTIPRECSHRARILTCLASPQASSGLIY